VHAANSAAVLRDHEAHFDMVRCGIAVYGMDPFGEDPSASRLEPALELSSYVADDNITVDLGADPDSERLRGEQAILLGSQGSERITAEQVARRLDTINYEVTCGLTPRVSRVYHRDGVPVGDDGSSIGPTGARTGAAPLDANTV
jgi:alanine racemase